MDFCRSAGHVYAAGGGGLLQGIVKPDGMALYAGKDPGENIQKGVLGRIVGPERKYTVGF